MALSVWQLSFLLFPAIALLHLYVSPYTKVEESFNAQAIHDILEYGVPVNNASLKFNEFFDHMTFPGAVPRTFIGALVLSGLSKPLIWLRGYQGMDAQICVRAVLGVLSSMAMALFSRAVHRAYGPIAAIWYVVLQASQFHIWYYASRTLPNTFSFSLSTIGLACLLPNSTSSLGRVKSIRLGLYLMTVATVIFRSELALLLGTHCIWLLLKPQTFDAKIRLIRTTLIPAIVPGAVLALVLTVTIDSYFWQAPTLLWPELSAFISNIFPTGDSQGASEWGTQPFYWYFVSALPRLLTNQLLLISLFFVMPSAWADFRVLDNLAPSFSYISLYSILPHKETRFLFPVVPSLTLIAALMATRLTINASKNALYRVLLLATVGSTLVTALCSHVILLPLSVRNYPGGEALEVLHEYYCENWQVIVDDIVKDRSQPQVRVHLTNLALQSGVTKFLEQPNFPTALDSALYGVAAAYPDIERRDPLILPGDEHHPALTIRPTIPSPSPALIRKRELLRSPTWVYDKTSEDTKLLKPAFWDQFDFMIVEQPGIAIGAWEVVHEIKAVGTPRLVKSGEQTVNGPDGTKALLHAMYSEPIASILERLHDIAYNLLCLGKFSPIGSITRGYWIEVPLQTKLFILKRATSGTIPNIGVSASMGNEKLAGTQHGRDGSQEEILELPDTASTDQKPLSFNKLGPLVVNKDGTLSRLDNWEHMTEQERKKTVSYLKKRNMLRLDEAQAAIT